MPLRAFGLFRHMNIEDIYDELAKDLNALAGVRSIPTDKAFWDELAGKEQDLNALAGVRSIPTDTVTNAERNKIKRLNALPGVRSIPT